MISTKDLSELLANLYAAPLEPQKWQTFLDRLCALTNTASGHMMAIHPEQGNVTLAGGGLNFDPETSRLYNEHYGANDPYAAPSMATPRIGIIEAEELVSRSDLYQSELYNEVLRPYDLEHMVLLSCGRAEEAGLFPFWRGPKQGPMDSASIHLLETLIPHVQTALQLRTKVLDHNASNLFSETALDAMSIAAFLVTSKGRVLHMNQLAAGSLESAKGLRLDQGRLAAVDSSTSSRLEQLIAQATSTKLHSFNRAPGGGLRLPHLNLTVVPTPHNNHLTSSGPCAIIFVADPNAPAKSRAEVIRQLYSLTPAEARVADHLLNGLEIREAADRLSITIETCRFHLKRIFSKTGTRRQSELLRLMLSLPGQ